MHGFSESAPFCIVSLALGLAAAIVFIVIQIILLVDFAHGWAENW